MIDEDAPHHLRGEAEELRAVLPRDPFLSDQPQVRLVDDSRWLQCVIPSLLPEKPRRLRAQLLIDHTKEAIASLEVSRTPCAEQRGDAPGLVSHGEFFAG